MTQTLPTMPIAGFEAKPIPTISFDGDDVELVLLARGGARMPLKFSRSILSSVVSNMTRVLLLMESIVKARGGPAELTIVEADRATAQAPIGAPFVALTVLTHLPLLQHFALSPTQADMLADQLRAGAEDARKNEATPRN